MLLPFQNQRNATRCLMLWWGYSTRKLQSLGKHLGKALKLYSIKSLISALLPSFFFEFFQNVTAPTLSRDRTQHYKPLHFPCSNSNFKFYLKSDLGHMKYSIWGLLVWIITSPSVKHLRKVKVEHTISCLPFIKFLVNFLCPELKGEDGYFSHPI